MHRIHLPSLLRLLVSGAFALTGVIVILAAGITIHALIQGGVTGRGPGVYFFSLALGFGMVALPYYYHRAGHELTGLSLVVLTAVMAALAWQGQHEGWAGVALGSLFLLPAFGLQFSEIGGIDELHGGFARLFGLAWIALVCGCKLYSLTHLPG